MAKAPKKSATSGETRTFTALHNILRDGETYEPGDTVTLDEASHADLKLSGAVAEEWADAEPAAAATGEPLKS